MSISPTTQAREHLIDILNTEFKSDRISVRPGFTDNSLGQTGLVAAVYSIGEEPSLEDRLALITTLQVEFLALWEPDPDIDRVVDPAVIESYAHRFRTAVAAYQQESTSDIWWFQLEEVTYEADPTGNYSRFSARFTAYGQNTTG
jgi:hypothetical protein